MTGNTINKKQESLFNIVFTGYFVPGHDPVEVKQAFAKQFGEKIAKATFATSQATLKRNVTQVQADKIKNLLHKMGLKIELVAVFPKSDQLSLVDPIVPAQTETATANNQEPPKTTAQAKTNAAAPAPRKKKPAHTVYSMEELKSAFLGTAKPQAASKLYLLSLLPVTFLMLLLPLVYIGITLLSAYSCYWVVSSGYGWFFDGYASYHYGNIIFYIASVIGTFLLTIFLARPFLSHSTHQQQPVRLDSKRERSLYYLVERITTAVGAPMPHEILVDCNVNASASLSRGVFSRSLTLTIGLPLLYGLNVQAVAAILAHEFGHFTQRFGMRASYIVHRINYWFYLKTHEHDNWDDWVEELMDSEHVFLQWGAFFAKIGSWLCRLLLHFLTILARIVSLSLSRQMEFDADRYEVALLGSSQYRKTAVGLRTLSAGFEWAIQDLNNAFDSGKLINNLPKYASIKAASFNERQLKDIAANIEQVNSSVFDTHPTDQARIKKALSADLEAKFEHAGSAQHLLHDIERLSQLCTLQWYRAAGLDVKLDDLIPLDTVQKESDTQARANNVLSQYFGNLGGLHKFLELLDPESLQQESDTVLQERLNACHVKLKQHANKFIETKKALQAVYQKQASYKDARFWLSIGKTVDAKSFGLREGSREEVAKILANLTELEQQAKSKLDECADLQGERLSIGLALAERNNPQVTDEINALKRAYTAIGGVDAIAHRLSESNYELRMHILEEEEYSENAFTSRALTSEVSNNNHQQIKLLRALEKIPDPYQPGRSLSASLSTQQSHSGNAADETLAEGNRLLRQLGRVSGKIEGRMAELALQVEIGALN